jgi:hypothetical protein
VRTISLRLLLLAVVLTATVGAGIFDVAFPDVVPARPYSHAFSFMPIWMMIGRDSGSSMMSYILIVTLVIVLISSLVRAVANSTTGITIAHTGFTPNPNITGSPGVASILSLYPLAFVFIGLFWAAKHFHDESRGI